MVDYREGDDPHPKEESEIEEEIPTTAFLVFLRDGNIDVATRFPGMRMKREATLSDLRDMAHVLYSDCQAKIIAKKTSSVFSETLNSALKMIFSRKQRLPDPSKVVNRTVKCKK